MPELVFVIYDKLFVSLYKKVILKILQILLHEPLNLCSKINNKFSIFLYFKYRDSYH